MRKLTSKELEKLRELNSTLKEFELMLLDKGNELERQMKSNQVLADLLEEGTIMCTIKIFNRDIGARGVRTNAKDCCHNDVLLYEYIHGHVTREDVDEDLELVMGTFRDLLQGERMSRSLYHYIFYTSLKISDLLKIDEVSAEIRFELQNSRRI